jgi:hypothetical protein
VPDPIDARIIRSRYYDADGTFLGTICTVHGGYTPADRLVRSKREPTGYTRVCLACHAEASRIAVPAYRDRQRRRTDAQVLADWDRLHGVEGLKACRLCGVEKPMAGFPRNRATPDGTGADCRSCSAEAARARRHQRP